MARTSPASATERPDLDFARSFAERFFAAWNSRDPDRVLELAVEDVEWEDPFLPEGSGRGHAAVRPWLASVFRTSDDLEFAPMGGPYIDPEGDGVAVAWRGHGTMTGPLDPPGFAPTGRHIEMLGVDIWEFRGDKLARVRSFTDSAAVARQLGAAPKPGSRGERLAVLMQRLAARRMRRQS